MGTRMKCQSAAVFIVVLASFLPFPRHATLASWRVSELWKADEVLDASDVILLPSISRYRGELDIDDVSVFGLSGRARLRQIEVDHVLLGEGDDIAESLWIVEPPGRHAVRMPRIGSSGEYILFLRRLSRDDVAVLRKSAVAEFVAERIPDEVWTFTHDMGNRWMSIISFSFTNAEGEVVDISYDVIRSQLERFAEISRDKESVVAYIKDLITLRDASERGEPVPAVEKLDLFQRMVVGAELEPLPTFRERMLPDSGDPWKE